MNNSTDSAVEFAGFYYSNLFPNFGADTQKVLLKTLEILRTLAFYSEEGRRYCLLVVFVVNAVHFVVLTRKSMRNNAVNIILAGMALNDVLSVVIAACVPINGTRGQPVFYYIPRYQYHIKILSGITKRNYAWLPILMAATRALVIKNFSNTKFSFLTTGRFGLVGLTVVVVVNSTFAIIIYLLMTDYGHSECYFENCEEFLSPTKHYRVPLTRIQLHDLIHNFTSSIIPAFCYPILTFILIRELRKAKSQTMTKLDNNNVTKLIITMTIFFMIPEFLNVFSNILMVVQVYGKGINLIGEASSHVLVTLVSVSSTAHCIICYVMSSSYKAEFNKPFKYKTEISAEVDIAAVR